MPETQELLIPNLFYFPKVCMLLLFVISQERIENHFFNSSSFDYYLLTYRGILG